MILAGDVGGTKTVLGLFPDSGGRCDPVRTRTYASRDWPGLAPLVADFLAAGPEKVRAAAFGVAGPVSGRRVWTPNLPFEVDADAVERETGIGTALLLNDLQAMAEGVAELLPDETVTLAPGEPDPAGNAALIAPGTGLGMSIVARPGGAWIPLAGEGGHQSFAPRNAEEERLRAFLAARHGRVSIERVVSGPGLRNVFEFLVEAEGVRPSPGVLARMEREDHSAVIGEAGLAGECEACVRALAIFVSALGAAAGDLALVSLARFGVWLGGGIPPKILPALRGDTFLEAFRAKGRFRDLVSRIPVRVVLNPAAALLGAARRARELPA